jgi:hypothetical protein
MAAALLAFLAAVPVSAHDKKIDGKLDGCEGGAAGEFAEVLDAIRGKAAYANVHSTKYPGGEIRAQLK